ncbi:MAG: 3-phosphoglycerate dehydrogenase [Lachnospiraceae bacterium]|jgi:D-3-phosphoglycerate dehydrogenase|nr:3-phosphoglycerate dehydrogenase [Lachnospiraceae bacterium]
MFKYHCLNPIAEAGLICFRPEFQQTDDLSNAQGVLVRSASMHDLDISTGVLAVARAGAGVNNIPYERYAGQGIVVFNTPGANANGVKELVITGMLLAARDIVGGINWVLENKADKEIATAAEKTKSRFAGTELANKKLGIIGLGAIGGPVANLARQMGMEVYGYDPYLSVDAAWNLSRDVKHVFDVNLIFSECDFITIHVPLTDDTRHIIDQKALATMKENVILLNFSRDLLVDEAAVVAALAAGKVRKYVTDFPTPITAGKEGCIVIPHLGASTEESEENCARMAVKQMMEYLTNGNIINSVNFPDVDMGICRQKGRVAVFHDNVANVITQLTASFGGQGINISDMVNKSKGAHGYTMLDIEAETTVDTVKKLEVIEGVSRVRVVK